jgi:L-seryl-tRNA(Ser) seleniumtransferase
VVAAETEAVVGAGSASGFPLVSAGVTVTGNLAAALRGHDVPVIARVVRGRTVLDLRCVDPADDELLARALKVALAR